MASECGKRGCSGTTHRRGVTRYCSQPAIYVESDRKGNLREWCYYHNPKKLRKFGEPRYGRSKGGGDGE